MFKFNIWNVRYVVLILFCESKSELKSSLLKTRRKIENNSMRNMDFYDTLHDPQGKLNNNSITITLSMILGANNKR